ncbi:hypothetical protein LR48_Vigan10g127300 [Vigna angularis]|uniref:Uncharacterized protein n=1 Tax=Phaseolus angularis TaxID=3914 RepID=A0A0L9VK06_PHAAN|nr:hypothetical protein LR48_Vigan10g127300 [Vigna angularis]
MANHPHSSRDETVSARPTRGATTLRQLMVRRNSGERTLVDVNVITGVTSSPNADVFRSYIGILARNRIFILTPSFDHVSEVDRNIIWNDQLDSLVKQSSQGKFTPEGCQYILTIAIERLEHPGRVCVVGTRVGIRDYFGSSSRQTSYAHNQEHEQRLTEEISKKLRAQLYDEVTTEAATVVPGMELSEDEVKVLVDDIIILDASVPVFYRLA